MQVNTILQGDSLKLAKQLPDNSVHMICTSPPYWSLRDYGTALWQGGSGECDHVANPKATKTFGNSEFNQDRPSREETKTNGYYKPVCPKCGATRIDAQMGLEETPEQYIENMVLLFRELRRVLRKDGSCWINMGDSYAGSPNGRSAADTKAIGKDDRTFRDKPFNSAVGGLKPKDLCGIPWRLALALQQDGWYLRSDIIWSKPNPMPESVTDRPTKAHEYLFLLTKSPKYFYDSEAIREPHTAEVKNPGRLKIEKMELDASSKKNAQFGGWKSFEENYQNPNGRNRRSVWEIATQPYPEAHFATFPEALIEPCILAGTSAFGCCNVCGAPFERIVEREKPPNELYTKSKLKPDVMTRAGFANSKEENGQKGSGQKFQNWLNEHPPQTIGWQPTCKCPNNTPVPAIVLDPFFGSGTTGSVAKRLGRYYLGFELNPDYIKLATKRINNTQPPLFVLT